MDEQSDCPTEAPTDIEDPICYEGMWIKSSLMDDPAFWACGAPSPDLMYPICNFDTGKWEEEMPSSVEDDKSVCGDIPEGLSYVVCNYVTGSW